LSLSGRKRTIARTAELEATLDRLLAGEVEASALARLSLTPTESRVAMALFKGQSVGAYAKEAGISIHTARWYVKQMHAKTGVRCQTQLFHLLPNFIVLSS
jgi:DNA-binding CsgD family transcriptional regulator